MIVVTSVNTGVKERLEDANRQYETGINKKPQDSPVRVGTTGLEKDVIVDGRYHGGPDQAVYLYRQEDYDWWSTELGETVRPGTFGENLTVAGLDGPALMVGDILVFPEVELQVTAPRIPCSTLAARMVSAGFVKQFMQAGRPGIYFRVLRTGLIRAGDEARLVAYEGRSISTVTFFHEYHSRLTRERIEEYLRLPIDIRSRTDLEKRLSALPA